MVETPRFKHEEDEDLFDGNAELNKLLGLEKKPVPVNGWIKDLKETGEDDITELITGERPSVYGSGTPKIDGLPRPVVANEGSVG